MTIKTTLHLRLSVEFLEKIIAYGKDEKILDDRTGQVNQSGSALKLMELALMIIETKKLTKDNPEEFNKTVDEFTKKRKLDYELEWINSLTDDQLKFLQSETFSQALTEKRDKNYDEWTASHRDRKSVV